MYQRKGKEPVVRLPNFKLLVPYDDTACIIIAELLTELGTNPAEVIDPKKVEKSVYIIHKNGEIGFGNGIKHFLSAPMPEMTFAELTEWKEVPLKITLAEAEGMIGHKLQIIEGEEK